MLEKSVVMPTVAVKDIEKAKKFYGQTLGLKLLDENEGGLTFESGGCHLFVYESEFAGTNKATYAAWNVKDIKKVAEDLKGKGVEFLHYDGLGKLDGDVHIMGPFKAAWFKDQDGNILSLDEM